MSDADQLKADADAALKAGQLAAAVDLYRAALESRPGWAAAHNNLAMALRQQGDAESSETHFRAALASEPNLIGALSNLGGLLVECGRFDEADDVLSRAASLKPNNIGVLYNLGLLAMQRGEDQRAIGLLQRSTSLKSGFAPAFFNLGNLSLRIPDYTAALAYFDRSLELNPAHKHAALNRAKALTSLGRGDEAYASLRQALAIDPSFAAAHSNLIFKQQYDPSISPKALYAEARTWNETYAKVSTSASKPTDLDPNRVLRVGYISPHLTEHPVGYFLEPVLANHDPGKVSVTCYSDSRAEGHQSRKLRAAHVTWQDVTGEGEDALADRVRADGIDILVDLDGHSGPNRLPVFARRAAPLQVTWAGYVGTTGLDAMDYLITDSRQTVDPDLQLMTEQPVYMPSNYVALAPITGRARDQSDGHKESEKRTDRFIDQERGFMKNNQVFVPSDSVGWGSPIIAPDIGSIPSQENGFVTFGSFNALDKINDQVVALWSEILKAVPDSRLKLITFDLGDAAVRARIESLFADHGVTSDRLDFQGKVPRTELFAAYNTIDIALDPFPYSGGLTTLEALWMGVPVITKRDGDRFASRHSTTHLTAVGLPECIADDAEDYVGRALALANDADRRATLKAELRETMRISPLCDGAAFTRALEQAYRLMWQRLCTGEDPAPITEDALKA